MRIFMAGLLGGIVLFFWGFVSHAVLPIGEMGMKVASNQDAALVTLAQAADKGAGVYLVPGMSPEQYRDQPTMEAFIAKYAKSPAAFVVYEPAGNPALSTMLMPLVQQFVFCVLAGLLVAWVLALGAFSFGQRVGVSTVMGLVAWLSISLPYWNWYRFPMAFTVGQLLDTGVGMVLAGVAMAWWLGRRRA